MNMAEKARHAFGALASVPSALDSGAINAYDILFLDGDTEPKIGWVDKNGVFRLVENKEQVVRVEELPTENGDKDVIYIYNNEGYIWNGVQCIPMSKSSDIVELENQISELETQIAAKVDESTMDAKIEATVETAVKEAASIEVVEF
jgi:hypothetical protein